MLFAYVAEANRERLKALGALQIDGAHVTGFCDKPTVDDPNHFHGFWASFGFSRAVGGAVLDFMMHSVVREKVAIEYL